MAERQVRVLNITRAAVLAERADLADSFFARVRGLLGRSTLANGEGLVIRPCNAVHTLGMAFPIDVVHLDVDSRVLRVVANLRPWRLGPVVRGSRGVVELPAGTVTATGTRPGDVIEPGGPSTPGPRVLGQAGELGPQGRRPAPGQRGDALLDAQAGPDRVAQLGQGVDQPRLDPDAAALLSAEV